MSNLSRKIRKHAGNRGGKLEAANAHSFKIQQQSQLITHNVYLHPTKGYKRRSKKNTHIGALTKAQMWSAYIAPTILRARKAVREGRA